jgi:hypothetical protein
VKPEAVIHHIEALPEPTRGIVSDYFLGAIPTLSSKTTLRDLVKDTMRKIRLTVLADDARRRAA